MSAPFDILYAFCGGVVVGFFAAALFLAEWRD